RASGATAGAAAEHSRHAPPRQAPLLGMIALDLSRLLSRAGRGTPTGIDRVELAYAEHLIATGAPSCFAAVTPGGGLGLLQNRAATKYIAAIGSAWRGEHDRAQHDRKVRQAARQASLLLLVGRRRAL